jgi:hypothetical protein
VRLVVFQTIFTMLCCLNLGKISGRVGTRNSDKKKRLPQVGVCTDNTAIASKFATYFQKHCQPSSLETNDALKSTYEELRANCHGNPIENQSFDVELISNLIEDMKKGSKAAGLDDLLSEHLKYSHSVLVVVLCELFNLFVSHSHIPASFGQSNTVPIPKSDGCKWWDFIALFICHIH